MALINKEYIDCIFCVLIFVCRTDSLFKRSLVHRRGKISNMLFRTIRSVLFDSFLSCIVGFYENAYIETSPVVGAPC